jgi:hypothetical protein
MKEESCRMKSEQSVSRKLAIWQGAWSLAMLGREYEMLAEPASSVGTGALRKFHCLCVLR